MEDMLRNRVVSAQPVAAPEIDRALESLHNTVARLGDHTQRLASRLAPVLKEVPAAASGGAPKNGPLLASPLARKIDEIERLVSDIDASVGDVHERLAL